jgi:hypothetical protein
MPSRTIVIGDVHGCLAELEALLARVRPGDSDRIWFIGDLVDRGPESAGVVRLARRLGAGLVRGNHDDKHVRFRRHESRAATEPGYVNPMRRSDAFLQVHRSLTDDDIAWLHAAPPTVRLSEAWVLVHGGLAPGDTPEDATLPMRLRLLDGSSGKPVVYSSRDPAPEGAIHWSERWTGPWRVLYGHHARPEVADRGWAIGIDTGAVYGGHLTAAVLDSLDLGARPSFVQVRSSQAWRPHAAWPEAAARLLAARSG